MENRTQHNCTEPQCWPLGNLRRNHFFCNDHWIPLPIHPEISIHAVYTHSCGFVEWTSNAHSRKCRRRRRPHHPHQIRKKNILHAAFMYIKHKNKIKATISRYVYKKWYMYMYSIYKKHIGIQKYMRMYIRCDHKKENILCMHLRRRTRWLLYEMCVSKRICSNCNKNDLKMKIKNVFIKKNNIYYYYLLYFFFFLLLFNSFL